mgnify:CR=1 FL=1
MEAKPLGRRVHTIVTTWSTFHTAAVVLVFRFCFLYFSIFSILEQIAYYDYITIIYLSLPPSCHWLILLDI